MEFIKSNDRIYCEDKDGKLLAEITFPESADDIVNINHTFVNESLRGQGVAGQLMQGVVDYIIDNNKRAYPTCSYAVKWFEKNKEYQYLVVQI